MLRKLIGRVSAMLLVVTSVMMTGCGGGGGGGGSVSTGTGGGVTTYTNTVVSLQILGYSNAQSAVLNQSFVRQFPATGGKPPYTWSLTSGSLPPGLVLSPNGRISGTPTATGSYTYTLKLTDSNGTWVTNEYTQTIAASGTIAFVMANPQIPAFGQNQNVGYQLFAQGPAAMLPWTFTITGLPAGVTYDPATGLISGTPTSAFTGSIVITLKDSNGNQATGSPVTVFFQVNAPQPVGGTGNDSGALGYSYWKGSIPNSYYTLNFDGERARKVTGKPFMALTYNKISLDIIECEFGLSEVTQVAIPTPSGLIAAPEPTLNASAISYQSRLNLISPVVVWNNKSSITNGVQNFYFYTGSSPGGIGYNARWAFTYDSVSTWGDVKNIDTTYYLGADSDSRAFSLLKQ